jgi:predicted ATPase
MPFLDAITKNESAPGAEGFPFDLPALRGFEKLSFESPVTFFIGENGSGKSTLLEAIAAGVGAVAVGADDIARDPTLEAARALAKSFRFVRRRAPKTKLFFRAEDAFGFTKRVIRQMAELDRETAELKAQFAEGSYAQRLAMGATSGQRGALAGRYGENPDARSHGETFLEILKTRIVPKGLYLLDEPETPLSPTRILALMALMKDAIADEAQFIIATHSPILMAFPGAEILEFSADGITKVGWEETEHVALTRAFLANPERYLRRL